MKKQNKSRRLPRSARVTVATAVLAAALSACSGGTGRPAAGSADQLSADPLSAVRGTADITGRTGSAHASTELVTESGQKKATFTGTGGYDYVNRIGKLEVAVPPGAATSGPLTEVVLPGTVYLLNSGAKNVPTGKWVKLDVRQLADGNLVSTGATDPASAAGALRGVQKADLVGTETMDGVPVKHYRGTLDLAKAADATGGHGADGLRLAAQTFTVKEIPYDAWLDEQGRLHRVVEVFSFSGVAGSKDPKDQVRVVSTVSLSAFGKPVEAAEPAAGDVYQPKQESSAP